MIARASLGGAITGLAVALTVVLVAGLGIPTALGLRAFTVMSGSMQPEVHVGDVVLDREVHPTALRPGNVITFKDPNGTGRLITHRVVGLQRQGALFHVVTKGDANHTVERFSVPTTGRVGRAAFRLPRIGYLLAPLHAGLAPFVLLIPVLLLAVGLARRILRSSPVGRVRPAAALSAGASRARSWTTPGI